MKVLVTGGCGFLGSHVCEYFSQRGAEVIAYDNLTKHELTRTGLATEAARHFNWNLLKAIGVHMQQWGCCRIRCWRWPCRSSPMQRAR